MIEPGLYQMFRFVFTSDSSAPAKWHASGTDDNDDDYDDADDDDGDDGDV